MNVTVYTKNKMKTPSPYQIKPVTKALETYKQNNNEENEVMKRRIVVPKKSDSILTKVLTELYLLKTAVKVEEKTETLEKRIDKIRALVMKLQEKIEQEA
tara:strand:- start:473 stop:772 length:300 start_codon:yes stop_codon:yes gene_type:complete